MVKKLHSSPSVSLQQEIRTLLGDQHCPHRHRGAQCPLLSPAAALEKPEGATLQWALELNQGVASPAPNIHLEREAVRFNCFWGAELTFPHLVCRLRDGANQRPGVAQFVESGAGVRLISRSRIASMSSQLKRKCSILPHLRRGKGSLFSLHLSPSAAAVSLNKFTYLCICLAQLNCRH